MPTQAKFYGSKFGYHISDSIFAEDVQTNLLMREEHSCRVEGLIYRQIQASPRLRNQLDSMRRNMPAYFHLKGKHRKDYFQKRSEQYQHDISSPAAYKRPVETTCKSPIMCYHSDYISTPLPQRKDEQLVLNLQAMSSLQLFQTPFSQSDRRPYAKGSPTKTTFSGQSIATTADSKQVTFSDQYFKGTTCPIAVFSKKQSTKRVSFACEYIGQIHC